MHYTQTNNGVRSIQEERQQSLLDIMSGRETSRPAHESDSSPAEREGAGPALDRLKEEALACRRCALRQGCRQVVFGVGSPRARLMLVGEGPGGDEDRQGIPFVGRAGQLLDRILEAARIKRDQVYITNVVKCRPPNNRLPVQQEVEACLPYLRTQFDLIDPEIIICLGSLATKTLIDKNASITRSRGSWHKIGSRNYMATFHPAALLRDPGKKRYVWEDFKEVIKVYNKLDEGGPVDE